MSRPHLLSVTLLLALLTGACDKPLAWGEWNSIIATAGPDQWSAYEGVVNTALQPRVFTVRPEKTFKVTYQEPAHRDWVRLRRFKSILVIGTEEDPWVAEALAESDRDTFSPPELLQVRDVWARGQLVNVMLVGNDNATDDVSALAENLNEDLDGQYREWVYSRMYVTGADTLLADSLAQSVGFSLTVPNVYDFHVSDSVYLFRNDNPDPSELIRQIAVTWTAHDPDAFTQEHALEWRTRIANRYYTYPQVLDLEHRTDSEFVVSGNRTLETRAIWANPPEDAFPAGGPLITRAVFCADQDRTYLVDAWLYAPGKDKYQYLLQLEKIVETFEC